MAVGMLYQVLKKLQKFVAELLKSSSNHVEILNFNFLYFFDSIILLRNVKKTFFFSMSIMLSEMLLKSPTPASLQFSNFSRLSVTSVGMELTS